PRAARHPAAEIRRDPAAHGRKTAGGQGHPGLPVDASGDARAHRSGHRKTLRRLDQLDQLLAEIAALEETDERLRRALDPIGHGFTGLELALLDHAGELV